MVFTEREDGTVDDERVSVVEAVQERGVDVIVQGRRVGELTERLASDVDVRVAQGA
jgi:hypothetical protein